MATTDLAVREYTGFSEGLNLNGTCTLKLDCFGPTATGPLVDEESGTSGRATFDGQPVTYLSQGSIRPQIPVIGFGDAYPVVVFGSGGTVRFAFPDGQPNFAAATGMQLTLDRKPGELFTPICFGEGTKIRTPLGDARIERLKRGDTVIDAGGERHTIYWVGCRELTIPVGLSPSFRKWLPARIPVGAFGEGAPYADLVVSQQHRILLEGRCVELITGDDRALASARSLVGDVVTLATEMRKVRYWHILCDRHVMLLANGLPVESMLPGDVLDEGVGREPHDDLLALFPQLSRVSVRPADTRPAARILKDWEGQVIARDLFGGFTPPADLPERPRVVPPLFLKSA